MHLLVYSWKELNANPSLSEWLLSSCLRHIAIIVNRIYVNIKRKSILYFKEKRLTRVEAVFWVFCLLTAFYPF